MTFDTDWNERYLQEYQKGDVVFEQNSEGNELFVIIEGSVEISQQRDSEFEVLSTIGKGEVFGEMALIDRIPRTARVIAAEDATQLIVVDQPRFIYLVSQQPVFALTIMRVLCNRIHNLEKRYAALQNKKNE